jgi:hypothetical protein
VNVLGGVWIQADLYVREIIYMLFCHHLRDALLLPLECLRVEVIRVFINEFSSENLLVILRLGATHPYYTTLQKLQLKLRIFNEWVDDLSGFWNKQVLQMLVSKKFLIEIFPGLLLSLLFGSSHHLDVGADNVVLKGGLNIVDFALLLMGFRL